jgi:hypothetical protein
MIRSSVASALGALAALALAARPGGALGAGVLLGYFAGAGLSGLGVLWMRHVLRVRPAGFQKALVVSFLIKLAALLLGALALRFVPAAAARADWQSFLVAYAAAVAIVLPLGSLDAAAIARRRASLSAE